MNIDSIKNGIVIDHIKADKSFELYHFLGLDRLDCSVALIRNASSGKMGKKDIIKIDTPLDIDTAVLGYIDPDITVNIIKNGEILEKRHLEPPEEIREVVKCANPRCITTTEPDIPHIFRLTDKKRRTYRCIYCDAAAEHRTNENN